MELNKLVASSLTDDEIQDLITSAESSFGVQPGNVNADVSYDITGSVKVSTDGSEITEEELASALETSIAAALNIHVSDVEVTIDPETGIATYKISSSNVEDANGLQEELQSAETNDEIFAGLSAAIPAIQAVS